MRPELSRIEDGSLQPWAGPSTSSVAHGGATSGGSRGEVNSRGAGRRGWNREREKRPSVPFSDPLGVESLPLDLQEISPAEVEEVANPQRLFGMVLPPTLPSSRSKVPAAGRADLSGMFLLEDLDDEVNEVPPPEPPSGQPGDSSPRPPSHSSGRTFEEGQISSQPLSSAAALHSVAPAAASNTGGAAVEAMGGCGGSLAAVSSTGEDQANPASTVASGERPGTQSGICEGRKRSGTGRRRRSRAGPEARHGMSKAERDYGSQDVALCDLMHATA